jgi:hypothetical protein
MGDLGWEEDVRAQQAYVEVILIEHRLHMI